MSGFIATPISYFLQNSSLMNEKLILISHETVWGTILMDLFQLSKFLKYSNLLLKKTWSLSLQLLELELLGNICSCFFVSQHGIQNWNINWIFQFNGKEIYLFNVQFLSAVFKRLRGAIAIAMGGISLSIPFWAQYFDSITLQFLFVLTSLTLADR